MSGTSGRSGLAIAALLACCLALAGCARTPKPIGAPPSSSRFGVNASGTIQFWARSDTGQVPTAMVQRFNATHPRIKVELTLIPGAQLVTKIATAIRGDSQPDLIGVDDLYGTVFTYNNALVDLTAPIGRLGYSKNLSPGMLGTVTKAGRRYGVPMEADLSTLWYNRSLFTRAGLDPDKPPRNYAEIVTAARRISALGGGVKGFSFAGNCPGCLGFTMLPNIWATGSRLIVGEPGDQRADVEGNVALHDTLELYRTIWKDGLAPPDDRTQNGSTWGKDFLAGRVGMLPGGYGTVASTAGKKLGTEFANTPLPGPEGDVATFTGGDNLVIPKGSHNPSAAWEFVRFVLDEKQQSTMPDLGFTPVRSDVLTPAYSKKYPQNAILLKALPKGYIDRSLGANTIYNQSSGAWPAMFSKAVYDGDVEGALSSGQSGFAQALKEADS